MATPTPTDRPRRSWGRRLARVAVVLAILGGGAWLAASVRKARNASDRAVTT